MMLSVRVQKQSVCVCMCVSPARLVARQLVSAGGQAALATAIQAQSRLDQKLAMRLQTILQMKMLL